MVFINGCDKESNSTSDQFSNKLTLGTGMNGFTINGETTNFSLIGGRATIYWRLESAADMAGSAVRIEISRQSTSGWTNDNSFNFPSTQNYGHIMLSSFSLANAGNYRATGVLVTGNVTVATKDFTVQ
jgi:hypothetical protein